MDKLLKSLDENRSRHSKLLEAFLDSP